MPLVDYNGHVWITNSESMKSWWILIIYLFVAGLLIYTIPAKAVPDNSAIINDNQSNYSNGIIINQPNLIQDAQNNYDNGILIVKNSVIQDAETTPATTQTSSSTSSSSGGGGGGGGGVASSENFSNILKSESREGNLIKDIFVSYKYNTISIYEILVAGKENEYGVTVKVEMLKDKPQKATIKHESEVIQYFNVITSTKRMKEAVIRFKSNQSAELLKWNGSDWIKLDMVENVKDIGLKIPQECIDKPEQQICYTYQTDSFSSFAVVKRTDVIIPDLALAPQNTATPVQTNTPPLSVQETPKQASGFTIILTIFILLIISRIKNIKIIGI